MLSENGTDSKNTILKAIALAYKQKDKMPHVLVSGQDGLARLILEIAEKSNIPIEENKELVSLLEKQKPGPVVSSKALKVLSEVVAFLFHSDKLHNQAKEQTIGKSE